MSKEKLEIIMVTCNEIGGGVIHYSNNAIGRFYIDGNMDETIVDFVTLNGRTLKSEKFLKKYTNDSLIISYKKKIIDMFKEELDNYNNLDYDKYAFHKVIVERNIEDIKYYIEDIEKNYNRFHCLYRLHSNIGSCSKFIDDRKEIYSQKNKKDYIINSLAKIKDRHKNIPKIIEIIKCHDYSFEKDLYKKDLEIMLRIKKKYSRHSIVDDFDKITTYAIENYSTGEIKEGTPKIIYKVFKEEIGLENTLFLFDVGKNKVGETIYKLTKNYPKRKEKNA